jgi:hypothetical protein
MAKARAVQQHLFLLPPGQVRESLGCSGTLESKEAVAVDTSKPNERLLQLLAAHALNRIAPEAIYFPDNTHSRNSSTNISTLTKPAKHRFQCRAEKQDELAASRHEKFSACRQIPSSVD